MTFSKAVASGFKHYARFDGRASRSEFWFWALFVFLIQIPFAIFMGVAIGVAVASGANTIDRNVDPGTFTLMLASIVLFSLVGLALFLPNLSMQIRRLHDINFAGWWWWIQFVPSVGSIILLIFFFLPSNADGARFDK